jgi:hypothetical protein
MFLIRPAGATARNCQYCQREGSNRTARTTNAGDVDLLFLFTNTADRSIYEVVRVSA